jgi:hypothetical protein
MSHLHHYKTDKTYFIQTSECVTNMRPIFIKLMVLNLYIFGRIEG